MINMSELRPGIRCAIQIAYVVYSTGLALFVVVLTIVSMLGIRKFEITATHLSALVLALLFPLIPFVQKIKLPGGGEIDWPESRDRRVNETLRVGLIEFQSRLSELDLNQIAAGIHPERDDG